MNLNSLDKKKAQEKIQNLVKELNYYRYKYYVEDISEITDKQYDEKYHDLMDLENQFPEFISADSPTQNVGGILKNEFKKVKHDVPVISLKDVFSKKEVYAFVNSMIQECGADVEFVVEIKFDGLTLVLRFRPNEKGILELVDGITRGDGTVGESVFENAKQIKSIPKTVNQKLDYLEVRGETYMTYKIFKEINEKRLEAGEKLYKNPRNLAGGTLRQLDPKIVKYRKLDIFIFNLEKIEGMNFEKHSDTLKWLADNKFPVSADYQICKTADEVWNVIEEIGKKRSNNSLPFPTDGAVIKVNQLKYREKLGFTNKVPKWAIAYKYPTEQKETVVKDIIIQVGRTGRFTPNAVLEPVDIGGTTVRHATLNNEEWLSKKDIRIGDTVILQKAGEIIPEIVGFVKEKRPVNSVKYIMSHVCPICGSIAVKEADGVDIKCVNPKCSARNIKSIQYFASKDAMNIKGLGDTSVETLVNEKYISNITDIYKLNNYKDELIEKGIIGKDKSIDNLLKAIEKSKENNIDKLITGLGIKDVAKSSAKTLAKRFSNMNELMNAKYEDIIALKDFGEKTTPNVINYFANEEHKKMIKELSDLGVNMISQTKEEDTKPKDGKLSGLTLVVTGTLPIHGRDEIEEMIEKNGGKATKSVSKKTNYVIAGEGAGSKLTKAQELGIKIISEEEFLDLLK